eukprot:jgi/Picsp_1/453/NSC_00451-R1_protein
MYATRFGGRYGQNALDKLMEWSDELFAATMSAYMTEARAICTDLKRTRPQCVEAVRARRAPEPAGHRRYDLFNPFITCPGGKQDLNRIGDSGDGGKWLCDDLLQREDCVVFSLGSNGQYDFERSLLTHTPCKIYTFDCTYKGKSQGSRHTYIEKCIGTREKAGTNNRFTTLAGAAKRLRVPKITLLKIDIEGYEFDEMAAWRAEDLTLPEQISIEMHHSQVMYAGGSSFNKPMDFSNLLWPLHNMSQSDLSLFFSHLSRLGYGIASREDNPIGSCCSEFLLLKIADWRLVE